MMDIKFRVWDKVNKRMLNIDTLALSFSPKGVLTSIYTYGPDFSNDPDILGDDEPDLDSVILEQFTGLKDVNGKDIYEGDIIKSNYKYAQPKVSQIIIEDGNSYILGEDLATGNEMLVSDHIGEIKVIGNVHTNPELVEADK
ncbi:YopX family protein [Secundilactobacillus paracollinoides]|uniref:YopX family protein n=1 Tax=Secundilactobacillus paracollinoides TaxID=240427 RepID=UPI0006D16C61|nr:YopX family protein [Secundilactobacillus paracollinoides]